MGRVSIPTGCVVVLTSCNMGQVELDGSHEALGMTAALLAQGAGAVVAPLWKVDEAVANQVMRRTTTWALQSLGKAGSDCDVAAALSRALLRALKRRESQHAGEAFASLSFTVYG